MRPIDKTQVVRSEHISSLLIGNFFKILTPYQQKKLDQWKRKSSLNKALFRELMDRKIMKKSIRFIQDINNRRANTTMKKIIGN